MIVDVLKGVDVTAWARAVVLLVILCCAVVDDIRRFRISNKIIMPGVILACMIAVVDCAVNGNMNMIIDVCAGGGIGFAAALAVYIMHGIGAGDVKLFMVCGMLTGYGYVCGMLVISLIAGVIIGVIEIIARCGKVVDVKGWNLHATHFSIGIFIGNVFVMAERLFM